MAEFQVTLPVALHARPAALLASAAGKSGATVKVGLNGRFVEAKSLLNVLSLGASAGSTVTIQVEGERAEAVAEEIATLIRNLA